MSFCGQLWRVCLCTLWPVMRFFFTISCWVIRVWFNYFVANYEDFLIILRSHMIFCLSNLSGQLWGGFDYFVESYKDLFEYFMASPKLLLLAFINFLVQKYEITFLHKIAEIFLFKSHQYISTPLKLSYEM